MTSKTLWYGCQLLGSQINKRASSDILDLCLDNNVLHFDLAERYPFPEQKETVGESEKIFGTWIERKEREKIYIGTKVTGRNSEGWFGEDTDRLTYNRIRTAVQTSLKRLKTDYIDIFFLHWPDRFTNNFGRFYYEPDPDPTFITFEEQFSALVDAYEKGEIKAIGLANETPWGLMRFLELNRTVGIKLYIQEPYSLLNRNVDIALKEIIIKEHLEFQVHSIFAGGLLTGKYKLENNDFAGIGRLSTFKHQTRKLRQKDIFQRYKLASEFCKENNVNLMEMAFAYVYSKKYIGDIILGASTIGQLQNIFEAYSRTNFLTNLTKDLEEKVYPKNG
jgi:aryl-alcohol dehydrogenase-like predicted oxidoreductase